jgi:hypothetical protein
MERTSPTLALLARHLSSSEEADNRMRPIHAAIRDLAQGGIRLRVEPASSANPESSVAIDWPRFAPQANGDLDWTFYDPQILCHRRIKIRPSGLRVSPTANYFCSSSESRLPRASRNLKASDLGEQDSAYFATAPEAIEWLITKIASSVVAPPEGISLTVSD